MFLSGVEIVRIFDVCCGKWKRQFNFELGAKFFFSITTDKYIIQFTGGSVIILLAQTGEEIKKFKGFNYLYTGDINPDQTELFALENGKHFYVFSLEDMQLIKRVTLPRSFESIDLCGEFSNDGNFLFVPVMKYVVCKYKYYLCKYETGNYTLVSMEEIQDEEVNRWPSEID